MSDIRTILDPLNVPNEVKAAAWDAFHASRNDAEFRIKFANIPLPRETKASLWDAKAFTPDQLIKEKPATPAKPVEPPGMIESFLASIGRGAQTAKDIVVGAGKGLGETAKGAIELLGDPNSPVVLPGLGGAVAPPMASVPDSASEPTNMAQSIGKGAERIGEFVVGGELLAPLRAMTAGARPALQTAARAGTEALSAAGVTAAQQGSTEGIETPAITAASLSLLIPQALKMTGRLANKIENVLVKPTKLDIEGGFRPENVFKYKVGGTLEATLQKTQEKIDNLAALARQLRSQSTPGLARPGTTISGNTVSIRDVLAEAAVELQKNAPRTQGMNQQILNGLKKELAELDILVQEGHLTQNYEATVDVAHQILQSVGERGSWVYGFRDPESVAAEKIANVLYSKLRRAIENAIPQGSKLREINKAMMELIPIKNAVIRRIPVEARNQAMHLSDIVTLSSGNLALAGINRALRSGDVARGMHAASQAPSAAQDILTRTITGATTGP